MVPQRGGGVAGMRGLCVAGGVALPLVLCVGSMGAFTVAAACGSCSSACSRCMCNRRPGLGYMHLLVPVNSRGRDRQAEVVRGCWLL